MTAFRIHPQPALNFGGPVIDNFAGRGAEPTPFPPLPHGKEAYDKASLRKRERASRRRDAQSFSTRNRNCP
ncbi:hypothetical protein, partial [Azotobacter salinestris]|uniref:hypothetical protein n=1 Tax=Azotobacter salinestris TaxID=69964 RepID=UPI0032DF32D6